MRAFWETGQTAETLRDHVSKGLPSTRLRAFRLPRAQSRKTALILEFTGVGRCQKSRSNILEHFPCMAGKTPTPQPAPAPSPSTKPRLTSLRTRITPPGSLAC